MATVRGGASPPMVTCVPAPGTALCMVGFVHHKRTTCNRTCLPMPLIVAVPYGSGCMGMGMPAVGASRTVAERVWYLVEYVQTSGYVAYAPMVGVVALPCVAGNMAVGMRAYRA
jgi:hypothetical protein